MVSFRCAGAHCLPAHRKLTIVKLDTDREGGPFFAMHDYVEASEKPDHSDQRLYRNYGGQIYDSPTWTDDM